ncbi:MAG: hypothetical protein JWO51_5197, partial [Rhodospirillales bacterium]|nr:hypothetical protein [Rhodospirillales bacterium]
DLLFLADLLETELVVEGARLELALREYRRRGTPDAPVPLPALTLVRP